MDPEALAHLRQQRAGGGAALYLAAAYLVAMPYFLLVVNLEGLAGPAEKVAALATYQNSHYVMYLITYVVFGIVLGALAQALSKRLSGSPTIAAVGGVVGFIWACMLVASGLIFNFGAGAAVELLAKSPAQAASLWQVIQPVADGLSSGQGELLGGLWVLLVSVAALRTGALPNPLNWLGVLIGVAGIVSVVPVLREVGLVFGLLQIIWFIWLGIVMLRTKASEGSQGQSVSLR
jgi:hypothetical protein